MRCYFLKEGRIAFVEPLERGPDETCICQCRELFEEKGKPRGADGFELWDEARLVYRRPE